MGWGDDAMGKYFPRTCEEPSAESQNRSEAGHSCVYLEFQCAYHSCTHIPYITYRHMHKATLQPSRLMRD